MRSHHPCWSSALLVAPVRAQVPLDYPVLGVTPVGDCEHAPDIWEIGGHQVTPGLYDFWFYPILSEDYGAIIGARFGLTWPSDWVLVEAELCFGTVLEDIRYPAFGLTLELPPEQSASRAAIRYRIHATSEGLWRLIPHPKTGDFAYRLPDGTWRQYDGSGTSIYYYALIGERGECSNDGPIYLPADWCSLHRGNLVEPGWLDIPDLELPEGVTYSDTLSGTAYDCYVVPECGTVYGVQPCIDGADADVDWLSFQFLDWIPAPPPALPHVVRCDDMTLIVGPSVVSPSTWGQIKARYKE